MVKERLNKRAVRSDAYQWRIAEVNWATHKGVPIDFTNDESLYSCNESPEIVKELNDLAIQRMFSIANEKLTDKQAELFNFILSGKTQWDVAKIMGVNQSSINKCLTGGQQYLMDGSTNKYGGITKKLAALVILDEPYRIIIKDINDLEYPSGSMHYLTQTFFSSFDEFNIWCNSPLHPSGITVDKYIELSKMFANYFNTPYCSKSIGNNKSQERMILSSGMSIHHLNKVYQYWKLNRNKNKLHIIK